MQRSCRDSEVLAACTPAVFYTQRSRWSLASDPRLLIVFDYSMRDGGRS